MAYPCLSGVYFGMRLIQKSSFGRCVFMSSVNSANKNINEGWDTVSLGSKLFCLWKKISRKTSTWIQAQTSFSFKGLLE